MVLRSCIPDLTIPNVVFPDYVLDCLNNFGDDEAIVSFIRISYSICFADNKQLALPKLPLTSF